MFPGIYHPPWMHMVAIPFAVTNILVSPGWGYLWDKFPRTELLFAFLTDVAKCTFPPTGFARARFPHTHRLHHLVVLKKQVVEKRVRW